MLVGGVDELALSGQLVELGLGTLQLPSTTTRLEPSGPGQKYPAMPQGLGCVEP